MICREFPKCESKQKQSFLKGIYVPGPERRLRPERWLVKLHSGKSPQLLFNSLKIHLWKMQVFTALWLKPCTAGDHSSLLNCVLLLARCRWWRKLTDSWTQNTESDSEKYTHCTVIRFTQVPRHMSICCCEESEPHVNLPSTATEESKL